MSMGILPMTLTTPRSLQCPSFSSVRVLMGPKQLGISSLSIGGSERPSSLIIRMGGGPRTYPGGVSKWQWKRMQAKKANQLLKARLCRERQIYEMRKRAELKAAVSELEKPWEAVEKAPTLFSVKADEQVKVLADRFQKPGGFDMWSERDGPKIFSAPNGIPSARFFPKGVVHSIKPYGIISDTSNSSESDDPEDRKDLQLDDWIATGKTGSRRRSRRVSNRSERGGSENEGYGDLVPSSPVAEGSYLNQRNPRVSTSYENVEDKSVEVNRVSRKNENGVLHRGRQTRSSSYTKSMKFEGGRNTTGNAQRDYSRGRDGQRSLLSSSRSRGNGRRNGLDSLHISDSKGVAIGTEERGRKMGSHRWFNTHELLLQAQDSHDAYRMKNSTKVEDNGA